MSERQHVSDAAWEAIDKHAPWATREAWEAAERTRGTVQITVAEHDELVARASRGSSFDSCNRARQMAEDECVSLRAEVERLNKLAPVVTRCLIKPIEGQRLTTPDGQLVLDGYVIVPRDEYERLRKERDESRESNMADRSGDRDHYRGANDAALLAHLADTLDHRLGREVK